MQLTIEIPEETYQAVCNGSMLPPHVNDVVTAIRDADLAPRLVADTIVIPKGARNLDALRAVFPNTEVQQHYFYGTRSGIDVIVYESEHICFKLWLPDSFADEPYKRESKQTGGIDQCK